MKLVRLIIATLIAALLWQGLITAFNLPSYILPSPLEVIKTFVTQYSILLNQAKYTFIETMAGLLLASIIGIFAALFISAFKPARSWILPLLIISQALPTFAIAPLFVIWLGYGMASKIAVTMLMIFFPITNSLYDGLRNTPTSYLDMARTMNASRWKTLRHIQFPAALPSLATGLRYAAVIAPLGAIIGEWVGSSAGLGYLILNANARLDVDMMFAAIIVITLFTLSLYFIVDLTLRKLIHWSHS